MVCEGIEEDIGAPRPDFMGALLAPTSHGDLQEKTSLASYLSLVSPQSELLWGVEIQSTPGWAREGSPCQHSPPRLDWGFPDALALGEEGGAAESRPGHLGLHHQ